MHNLGEWLEHFGWVQTINTTNWLYSLVEVVHYFTIFVVVGTNVVIDLRILGILARRQPTTRVTTQVFPWMWTAFGFAMVSGFLLSAGTASEYFPNWVFDLKMWVILAAVVPTIILQAKISKWGSQSSLPGIAKVVAVISIILWVGTILAGVEVSAISGLG